MTSTRVPRAKQTAHIPGKITKGKHGKPVRGLEEGFLIGEGR